MLDQRLFLIYPSSFTVILLGVVDNRRFLQDFAAMFLRALFSFTFCFQLFLWFSYRLLLRSCYLSSLCLLLDSVACHNSRLDEEHLYFLAVNICSVRLSHLIVVVRRHSVHRYELRNRRLAHLAFLNLELQVDDCFLEAIYKCGFLFLYDFLWRLKTRLLSQCFMLRCHGYAPSLSRW